MNLSEIKLNPANPRTIKDEKFAFLKRSIQEFPQMMTIRPIVIDDSGVVLGGNMRLQALKALGHKTIPDEWVKRVDDLTPEQKQEFIIKDNAGFGQWDWDLLANEWSDLPLSDWGVDMPEDWAPIEPVKEDESAVAEMIDNAAELQKKWKVKRGQIWEIGKHRLMCGDCRESQDVTRLMGGSPINVAVTSPPYAEQREYDESSGFKPVPPNEYVEWFAPVSANVASHLADDGSWFINIKPSAAELDTELYVFDLVLTHVRQWGWHFASEFCWERIGVPKLVTRRFKNQFEPVYQFARGRWKIRPDNVSHFSENVPKAGGKGSGQTSWKGAHGNGKDSVIGSFGGAKKRKNGSSELMSDSQGHNTAPGEFIGPGMAYPGNRIPPLMETHEALGHSAAFPVGLPLFFIKAFSDEGDAVFEPFTGSGSTIVAAHQSGRVGYGIELSAGYCSITLERLSALGLTPKLTNETETKSNAVQER